MIFRSIFLGYYISYSELDLIRGGWVVWVVTWFVINVKNISVSNLENYPLISKKGAVVVEILNLK